MDLFLCPFSTEFGSHLSAMVTKNLWQSQISKEPT